MLELSRFKAKEKVSTKSVLECMNNIRHLSSEFVALLYSLIYRLSGCALGTSECSRTVSALSVAVVVFFCLRLLFCGLASLILLSLEASRLCSWCSKKRFFPSNCV